MKKTICLNMIVKNESHIIEESLDKLCKKINFDYWVICDTGSSDDTPNIIQKFFDQKKIKGELYFDTWKDFAHNRTLALERAFNKTDYLLVFDADDEIEGNLVFPELTKDGYQLKFGRKNEYTYDRTLLLNNHKKWKYIGVLHEIIQCLEKECTMEMILGDYCVVSGRKGSRSKDPNKYHKDGIILEKAFIDAMINNDHLAIRYAFYCANSFYDAGHYEKAIEWYKRFLKIGNWDQEKYVACCNIYLSYNRLNQKENGFFYLIDAFTYDRERPECLFQLLLHYCYEKQFDVAYSFYSIIQNFYENNYLNHDFSKKLFYDKSKGDLLVPYFMIIISLNLKKNDIALKMYEIIFKKKYPYFNEEIIKNILHNFQFVIKQIPKNNKYFFNLFENYLSFIAQNGFPIHKYMEYVINYRINYQNNTDKPNLVFFTGSLDKTWNYTYAINNALGGSETAVAFLSEQLSQNYNVYVVGDVIEEITENNVYYVHNSNLQYLISILNFKTVIISRFLAYLELIPKIKTQQIFIWAHDIELISGEMNITANRLLQKWNHKINGCICLTEWHANLFKQLYPELNNKLHIINNGINLSLFNNISTKNKVKNQFIYTSRSERGLYRLLELWPTITTNITDATLVISSYNDFPKDANDKKIEEIIKKYSNIKHYGKLNKKDLYVLMTMSEYWFYPCGYPETSCITAMEMMMAEVICVYYPLAGLVNTIGNFGISVDPSKTNEAELLSIISKDENEEMRNNFRKKAKSYAELCSWEHRKLEWNNIISKKHNKICILIVYSKDEYYDKMKKLLEHHYKNYNDNANIDYYFISYDPNLEQEYTLGEHDLVIKGDETLIPGILNKTLFAFDLFKNKYDYFIRSNISTIIDIDNLTKYLDNNYIDYGGFVFKLNWLDIPHNIVDNTYFGTLFVQGTSITLSNKTINFILDNRKDLPNIIDDVAIGYLLNKHDIIPINHENDYVYQNATKKIENIIFYRNKTSYKSEFKNNKILKHNLLINMTNVINELHPNGNQIYVPNVF